MTSFDAAFQATRWNWGRVTYTEEHSSIPIGDKRIVLPVFFKDIQKEESFLEEMFLDSGSPYNILRPDLFRLLHPPLTGEESFRRLEGHRCSSGRFNGFFMPINVTLRAEEGDDMTLRLPFFVPEPGAFPWNLPCFLGVSGFLDSIKTAIDPQTHSFYFSFGTNNG